MSYENVLVEKHGEVGVITLNRPKALNALCASLIQDLGAALEALEADDEVGVLVLIGSDKAFAAGADIKEMKDKTFVEAYRENFITDGWERVSQCNKPIIAAVSGYALGGGCEMAMMCDFILAADNAKFGQPEVTIGTIPGAGGTQRLTRLVGKSKAMDMCLTGRMMDAEEAERAGLVSRVLPLEGFKDEVIQVAQSIAALSRPVIRLAKDAVDSALETTLTEGVRLERKMFHASFAFEDKFEGMNAFAEKRKPAFKNR
ncbi:MAG TPA: enoyl-CoA hydratase [Gammaproteobacteria bacterium]|nr:enoyl-CoA hydratase [Gammaproteobacteria bacterium]